MHLIENERVAGFMCCSMGFTNTVMNHVSQQLQIILLLLCGQENFCKDNIVSYFYVHSKEVENKEFMPLFIVFFWKTKDMRDEDSPSWFNPGEVLQVIQYLQGLLGNKAPLHPDNIGIITPYRKQVRSISLYIL